MSRNLPPDDVAELQRSLEAERHKNVELHMQRAADHDEVFELRKQLALADLLDPLVQHDRPPCPVPCPLSSAREGCVCAVWLGVGRVGSRGRAARRAAPAMSKPVHIRHEVVSRGAAPVSASMKWMKKPRGSRGTLTPGVLPKSERRVRRARAMVALVLCKPKAWATTSVIRPRPVTPVAACEFPASTATRSSCVGLSIVRKGLAGAVLGLLAAWSYGTLVLPPLTSYCLSKGLRLLGGATVAAFGSYGAMRFPAFLGGLVGWIVTNIGLNGLPLGMGNLRLQLWLSLDPLTLHVDAHAEARQDAS